MFLQSQGELALGSRFKAASESLYATANAAYRAAGVELGGHWFQVLRYLHVKGPADVSTIATAIGQTHSAVSQLASKLQRADWIVRTSDRADARRSVLDLSAEGERRLGAMGPIWCAIRRGARRGRAQRQGPLLETLAISKGTWLTASCCAGSLPSTGDCKKAKAVVKTFRSEWREHFYRNQRRMVERYFTIEEVDRRMLSEPETYVLEPGGTIVFALIDGEVIGTCALLKEASGVYELSKMAVETGWRGIGAGRLLLDGAIAEFRKRRGQTLFLESNSKLGPALKLYESAGFVHQPAPRPGSHYQRADVYMIYAPGKRRSVRSSLKT